MVCCELCLVYGCKGCQQERRWKRDINWPAIDQLSRSCERANACSDRVRASYSMLCATASCSLRVKSLLNKYAAGALLYVEDSRILHANKMLQHICGPFICQTHLQHSWCRQARLFRKHVYVGRWQFSCNTEKGQQADLPLFGDPNALFSWAAATTSK